MVYEPSMTIYVNITRAAENAAPVNDSVVLSEKSGPSES